MQRQQQQMLHLMLLHSLRLLQQRLQMLHLMLLHSLRPLQLMQRRPQRTRQQTQLAS